MHGIFARWKTGRAIKSTGKPSVEWEGRYPELTEEVRSRFTDVYKQLHDPERDGKPGLRRKNPRICPHERLKRNADNCAYGDRGHGQLCWKFKEFIDRREKEQPRFIAKHFARRRTTFRILQTQSLATRRCP